MLASLFLIGALSTTPQMSVQAASQSIVEEGPDGVPRAVNRMIGGIISYVRWPSAAGSGRTLCLVGTPRLTDHIAPTLPGGETVAVRRTSTAQAMARGDCDILFLGRVPVADRQRLVAWVRGRAIVTITDDDPTCLYGAMFCLAARPAGIGFSVNLDSVGRGTLRIDPRVLKIGQGEGSTP
ncbi:MAG: DUF4154 domain-containing protein [Sphingopyxis macrogoltabida]|uniref:DUF4154 domain-containing protein n=1 Tax=Sphingopyxis macrogoltabida TaxID=33050 RepID=A0A2W5L873_SPHMC|nr:MAG: DUF4154 domain-containing protein [Sphingopyxis macrogoltabida]